MCVAIPNDILYPYHLPSSTKTLLSPVHVMHSFPCMPHHIIWLFSSLAQHTVEHFCIFDIILV